MDLSITCNETLLNNNIMLGKFTGTVNFDGPNSNIFRFYKIKNQDIYDNHIYFDFILSTASPFAKIREDIIDNNKKINIIILKYSDSNLIINDDIINNIESINVRDFSTFTDLILEINRVFQI